MRNIPRILRNVVPTDRMSNRSYLLLLIFVGIASHILWFTPGTVLFHQDWLHSTNEAASQAWQAQGSWKNLSGFGGPNIQLGYYLMTILWPLITFMGGSFDAAVKVSVMIPIAILGFVAPYLAVRKLFADNFVAFVTALFYGSTTYFLLRQGAHLPIAFVYALTPLIFTFLLRALESKKIQDWLIFALTYTVGLCYEPRIMYIVTCVLLMYIVMFYLDVPTIKKLIKPAFVVIPVIICLNAFWLIPTIFGGADASIAQTTSRELFGNGMFDLPHALTLSPAGWTGEAPDENFVMQPIKLYLWLIPFVIISLIIKVKGNLSPVRRKEALFFLIIALAGIFLTKQVLDPLPQAYPWLYAHFPGFSLFREGSKFYQLTAWGYMGLLAVGLVGLRKVVRPTTFHAIAAIPIIVAALNLSPLVTGSFRTLFVTRHMPRDYSLTNKKIAATPGVSRTLWVPSDPKWAYFDMTHPKASAVSVVNQDWKFLMKPNEDIIRQKFLALFGAPVTKDLAGAASIKFVVVPLRDRANDDDFIKYFGNDRQFYIDLLDKTPWLKRVDYNTKEVAIYENQRYRPHIASAADPYTIASTSNLDALYDLQTEQFKKPFSFVLNDEGRVKRGISFKSLMEDPGSLIIKPGNITTEITSKNESTLYANTNRPIVSYKVNESVFELYATYLGGLKINDKVVDREQSEVKKLASLRLNPKRNYYVVKGDEVIPIKSLREEERNLGVVATGLRLVSDDKTNLIPNSSFEKGSWKERVDNCSVYDSGGFVAMQISDVKYTDGKKSLELYAEKNTACTGPNPISVSAGKEYVLGFNYRVEPGGEAGYQVSFNDPGHTSIRRYPVARDQSWHSVRQAFVVPKNATKVTVKLLGVPNPKQGLVTTNFDNVHLSELTTDNDPNLDVKPVYQNIALEKGRSTLSYTNPTYSGKNLIPNASLEKGLWQKKVGDCNAYDNEARLKMKNSDQASDGKRSLELAARQHIACTGPPAIPVKENTTYLLSFDHQSPNTKQAGYYVDFNDQDSNTSFSKDIPTASNWQNFAQIIKTPTGTSKMHLSVFAKAPGSKRQYTINHYDNFKLIEVPDINNQYQIVDEPDQAITVPKKVSYTFVNPTKKLAHISGAKGPFYLTMSESYNPNWRLELNNDRVGWLPWARPDSIAAIDHIKWDNFLNGWYVDPAELCKNNKAGCTKNNDGSYNLEMIAEFTPQRWFYVGALTSGLTLVGTIGYLGFTRTRRRDRGRWSLR